MRYILKLTVLFLLILAGFDATAQSNPKREFRGAWMHTIGQGQYRSNSTQQNKDYIIDQLDKLQAAGVNAVMFQVRPCADAFYKSKYELWSKYLTADGKAPSPYWDPLAFIIQEAHARGMELHAWLNPYRVTTAKNEKLPAGHLYHKEPGRFVKYAGDGKIYFDPGLPENREYIVKVVMDIVNNYDVDGIHFDDYFYPYPANKQDFPDQKSYAKYGKGMAKGDWRRKNTDMLIEKVHDAIRASKKPWVRFGVSPFGIWRNKKNDKRGSDTSGLENYGELYADVLLWAEKGWVDYLIPQLYWELDHPRASYMVLVDWWAQAVDPKCQLYIGQDVERTMSKPDLEPSTDPNQLDHKMTMARQLMAVDGNCWWPGYSITKNSLGCADSLATKYQSTLALVPAYPEISDEMPLPVKKFKAHGRKLSWEAEKAEGQTTDPVKFVVYCFPVRGDGDYDDARNIYAITQDESIEVDKPGRYCVTVIDRVNNESNPSREIVVR